MEENKMLLSELNNFRKTYGTSLCRGFLTFFDNYLTYLLNKKPRRGPLYLDWEVTYRCNAKCTYCNSWKIGREITKKELKTEEALRIIRELGKRKIWLLIFTGGEPLIRSDIFTLIKEAKNQGISVNINTNGMLLKKYAKKLVDLKVDSITISAESYKASIHDKIRGTKRLFELLSEGIEEIKKLRNKKPIIKIRMEVGRKTYKEIEKYINYWKPKVDEVILQPIHEGIVKDLYKVSKEMKFKKDDEKAFRNYFHHLFKKYKFLRNLYYKEFPNFFFNKVFLLKKYKCFAGYFFLQIDPYGNVYPCTEYITKVGNLKKESFNKIWQGKKLNDFRRLVKKHKNKCFCWYYCTGPINSYLTKLTK